MGKELAFLPTGPANQTGLFDDWRGIPSNAEFGVGTDSHTLYLTIDRGLFRIHTKTGLAPPPSLGQAIAANPSLNSIARSSPAN